MQQLLRHANVVLFVVNVALFGLWWSMIRIDSVPVGGTPAEYMISQAGLEITVLGVIIGLVALFLAGVGFIGFQTVLERAERMADRTARDVVARLANDGTFNDSGDTVPTPSRNLPDVSGSTEVQDDVTT